MGVSDTYPAGLVKDTSLSTTNTCGGALAAAGGGTSISLSGGTVPANGSCAVTVDVTSSTLGTVTNTTGVVTSNEAPNSGTASDDLTVSAPIVIDPGVTKSGNPLTAQIGDMVTFTLSVSTTGDAPAEDVEIEDVVPSFLDILSVSVIPTGPDVDITGNTITIDFFTVDLSESFIVTITTVVNDTGNPPGGLNEVTLTTTSDDADPDNNIDSVYINIVSPDDQDLPATGFAPNRRTILPSQPAHLSYQNHGQLWLEIPTLGVETSIVGVPLVENGWDVTWLWDKAGYLAGTAFPTWSGNSVITGHVVLANGLNGPFARLKELEYGDAVIVHGWGEQYVYEIRETDIVSPHDPSVLRHEEFPWLTLVTCAGYDETSDSYRWRVVARAVMMSIDSEANSWLSSRTKEQPDVHPFDRVGSGGVQP